MSQTDEEDAASYTQEDLSDSKNQFIQGAADEVSGDEEDEEENEENEFDKSNDLEDQLRPNANINDFFGSDNDEEDEGEVHVSGKPNSKEKDKTNNDEKNNQKLGSKLEYILNYKKRTHSDQRQGAAEIFKASEEPPAKKSTSSKTNSVNFVAGTTKGGTDSILYGNAISKDDVEGEEETDPIEMDYRIKFGNRAVISDKDFAAFHRVKQVLKRLKEIEQKEQIVKLLPPKEFRFKIFLENYFEKLASSKFSKYSDVDLKQLKSEYKNHYLRYKKFQTAQRKLQKYRKRIEKLQSSKFIAVPYSPGNTPWHVGRKYLTMNKYGVVWIETKTSRPIITFNTYDKSIRDSYWFNVDQVYDLCCLSRVGLVLAKSGYYLTGTNESNEQSLDRLKRFSPVLFKSHDGLIKFQVLIELLKGEYITTVSLADDTINVFLSSGMVKKFSVSSGVPTGVEKTYPTVCSIGNDKFLFNILVKDPYKYQFMYTLKDAKSGEFLATNVHFNLPIKANKVINVDNGNNKNITTQSLLKAVLFNDFGFPCYVDNNDYLHILNDPQSEFQPILNLVEAFNKFNSSHNNLIYFPLSMTESNLQVIVIKDANLESKLKLIQSKIDQAERETRAIENEIRENERKRNRMSARDKKKQQQEEIQADQLQLQQPQQPQQKPKSKQDIINEKKLKKYKKILDNKEQFIKQAHFQRDNMTDSGYNYPWFPLPGLNNFKIELPLTTAQHLLRNTRFNDPKLDNDRSDDTIDKVPGLEDSDDENENQETFNARIDLLFEEESNALDRQSGNENLFNKMISTQEQDFESITAQFFSQTITNYIKIMSDENDNKDNGSSNNKKNYVVDLEEERSKLLKFKLKADLNLIKMFHQLLELRKFKLAFNLVKFLQLKQSFDAIDKICLKTGVSAKFRKVIGYWREKKIKTYGSLIKDMGDV